MKGARDELWATTISAPNRNSVNRIGNSHQRLFFPKKWSNSPAVWRFRAVVRMNFMKSPLRSVLFREDPQIRDPHVNFFQNQNPICGTPPGREPSGSALK